MVEQQVQMVTEKSQKKKATPSFVVDIPLLVNPQQEKELLSRFEAGRQMYNACLGEAKRRLELVRQSKLYQKARAIKKKCKERTDLFNKARFSQYDFSDYGLQKYATRIQHSWIGDHIDSATAQKIGTRAYNAAQRLALGTARKVRFKGKNQMDSLESKSNSSGIRWRDGVVKWDGMELVGEIKAYDPVILHGLNSRVKYVRLVRRKVNGKNLFYAQLVCEGFPFQKPKNKLGTGDVGLDIGPSTIAVVGENHASLQQFCDSLQLQDKKIRKLQRKMARSQRANNPDNYEPDFRDKRGRLKKGKVKKGKKKWKDSQLYLEAKSSKANLERKLAAHRKSLHGEMVNSILSEGNVFKLEKLSYKAFQKLFGKSVGRRAPGMFVSHLKRKAESAGGKVVEFPTYNTKLSQTCQCGRVEKKKLSQRVHKCKCGVHIQRDLYSAFLAKFIHPDTMVLQVSQVLKSWQSTEPCLRAAWRTATQIQPATGRLLPTT